MSNCFGIISYCCASEVDLIWVDGFTGTQIKNLPHTRQKMNDCELFATSYLQVEFFFPNSDNRINAFSYSLTSCCEFIDPLKKHHQLYIKSPSAASKSSFKWWWYWPTLYEKSCVSWTILSATSCTFGIHMIETIHLLSA